MQPAHLQQPEVRLPHAASPRACRSEACRERRGTPRSSRSRALPSAARKRFSFVPNSRTTYGWLRRMPRGRRRRWWCRRSPWRRRRRSRHRRSARAAPRSSCDGSASVPTSWILASVSYSRLTCYQSITTVTLFLVIIRLQPHSKGVLVTLTTPTVARRRAFGLVVAAASVPMFMATLDNLVMTNALPVLHQRPRRVASRSFSGSSTPTRSRSRA